MKTVAVIFGLIFLVYLVAWLGSLDMAARIAALLLIAVKAVGLGLFGDTVEAGPRPACQDSHRECRLSKARRSCGIACALNFCRPGPSGPVGI